MEKIILPEIVAVGIYNAQLVLKKGSETKNRRTTMFEVELPIEEGGVSFIDDETHPISPNTLICAKPGQLRHTRLPFKCYYIHIIVKSGILFDLLSELPNFIELSDSAEVKAIFETMIEAYGKGTEEEELLIHSLILKLAYLLRRDASKGNNRRKAKANNQRTIEKTIEYIKNNLTESLNLETMANMAKFTPTYFHKLFKASTGKTLHDYIEEQRIKKSVGLLTSTDMTLTEIAYECGFSSQSYFSYAFKRRMNLAPREFAKEIQLKYESCNNEFRSRNA